MKKILTFFVLVLILAGCARSDNGLKQQLPGTWQNPQGFQIRFDAGGGGFIPGVKDAIPDTPFTYTIVDDTHIRMDAQGQSQVIEIHISEDTFTWKDSLGEVKYTRVKK